MSDRVAQDRVAQDLASRKCAPCEGGMAPLTAHEASALRAQLHADWTLAADAKSLERALKFKDFYRTMSFVNAVAHIANVEDHHPDLEVGYNYCRISYSTHSIGGLSQNDFICAAKIDRL
jgi:4a-hydroxytetrahydrobiopterin dehydratase